ncbi:MAG TPA: hypothetical protein VKM94_26305 [Blastocatellia bacterium]|nr:hypothetical protein [Blastocatellia bacterium]
MRQPELQGVAENGLIDRRLLLTGSVALLAAASAPARLAWAESSWEALGGRFNSPPAVASWGADRLDIFGLGTDIGSK